MNTILVVDHQPECLTSVAVMLRMAGYEVIAKRDACSALAEIKAGATVDLVVTESCLPDMDGLEFLRSFKQVLPAIPFIMVTANGSVDGYLRALRSGVFEYFHKPVTLKELRETVHAALRFPKDSSSDQYSHHLRL